MKFELIDTCIYSIYSMSKSDAHSKVASFDLDGTIITTKSGARFPKNKDDWKFWNDSVPTILREYYDNGYRIVIFTNQLGLSKVNKEEKNVNILERQKTQDFIHKLRSIRKELGVGFDVFISTENDCYRKPMTCMWDYFISKYPGKVSLKQSFYCGDAAGRPKDWMPGMKKDFSNSDLNFAKNIGVRFEIPENIFNSSNNSGGPIKYQSENSYSDLDLKSYLGTSANINYTFKPCDKQELIIMVGRPGSGKSEIAKKIESTTKYVYISRDICGTQLKCLKMMKDAIKDGKSVIIDNTNPSKKSRGEYIKDGKNANKDIYVRVLIMDIPEKLSKHLNYYRTQTKRDKLIPQVAYNMYNKLYEEPSLDEGIDKVEKIPFVFKGNNRNKKIFMYSYM